MVDPEVQKSYDEFWRPIVENPDGTIDKEALMKELHDFRNLIDGVPKVYKDVTGGLVSKPNTDPDAVISLANDNVNNLCDVAAAEAVENCHRDWVLALNKALSKLGCKSVPIVPDPDEILKSLTTVFTGNICLEDVLKDVRKEEGEN